MKTRTITLDQMRSQIARFSERKVHMNHRVDASIPAEAFAALNPPLYLLLSHPAAGTHPDSLPAVVGAKGMSVSLLDIPPGGKVPLHVHLRSRETFMCLKGRIRFRWNDQGENETILEPFDLIDVPVGVYRDFQCVGDHPALLLAIITDDRKGEPGDVVVAPEERAGFAERFGAAILPKLTAATGLHFADPSEGMKALPTEQG